MLTAADNPAPCAAPGRNIGPASSYPSSHPHAMNAQRTVRNVSLA